MKAMKIEESLYWVGAMDWDRRMFDELIPLPEGTSYNAYLLQSGGKTVLFDAVDPTMADTLFARLESLGVKKIDYLVAHHAEQDHSGSIPAALERFPMAQLLCTPKCRTMLIEHVHVKEDRIREVKDGETLELGDATLKFIHFPWVHWPETMLTWCPERKLLFTCDLFGSHKASSEIMVQDEAVVLSEAKRYYAEIMMPFAGMIAKSMAKLSGLDIRLILPSHGPVYPRPALIMDAYRDWLSAPPKNLAIVAYVSMHDSTRRLATALVDALCVRGVRVEQYDLTKTDIGKLACDLVDAATVVLGSPIVLGGAHPVVANAAYLTNLLRPKTKWLGIFGSYGWGGKLAEQLGSMLTAVKAEVLPPVLVKGLPRAADYAAIEKLADEIAARHAALKEKTPA
jgi:flavorubredoxin